MTSPLSIRINGEEFSDWLSFSCTFDTEAAASTFEAEVSQRWQTGFSGFFAGEFRIQAGSMVEVYADGELIITGIVDVHTATLSATDHTVQLGGRSTTGALVDSSIIHPTYMWRDKSIIEIATEICAPFGIPVSGIDIDGQLDRLKTFKVDSNASAFDALTDLANRAGFIIQPTATGGLEFARSGQTRLGLQLTAYTDVSVTWDFTDRHSEFIASGQKENPTAEKPKSAAQVAASIRDEAILSYRPKIVPVAGNVSQDDALTAAAWARSRSIANALTASATVTGIRDANGNLWRPNTRIWFTSPQLSVDTELLIKSVTYRFDSGGIVTDLSMTHPNAYDPDSGKGNGGDDISETGDDEKSQRQRVNKTKAPGIQITLIDDDPSDVTAIDIED
jgi:prophage tail gpP-like protein